MKNYRKKNYTWLLHFSIIFALIPMVVAGCQNNTKHTKAFSELQHSLVSADSSVFNELNKLPTVYYFHYTRRCITCNAIEKTTKETINEFYKDKVTFIDFNLDEADGKTKGEELKIAGQTLLIVAGAKKINLTNEAFMNAKSNPDKLKQIIKAAIDPILE